MSLVLLTAVFCSFLTSRHSSKAEGNIKTHNDSKLFYKLIVFVILYIYQWLTIDSLLTYNCYSFEIQQQYIQILFFSASNYFHFHILLEWDERQEKRSKCRITEISVSGILSTCYVLLDRCIHHDEIRLSELLLRYVLVLFCAGLSRRAACAKHNSAFRKDHGEG